MLQPRLLSGLFWLLRWHWLFEAANYNVFADLGFSLLRHQLLRMLVCRRLGRCLHCGIVRNGFIGLAFRFCSRLRLAYGRGLGRFAVLRHGCCWLVRYRRYIRIRGGMVCGICQRRM